MSDVKISALPAAATIASTDVTPVVTGGVTSKVTAQAIVNAPLAANVAGTNPTLIGPATSANSTRFPNTQVVVSSTAAGIQQNESHNIGLIGEGVANAADTSIYGVGVYGVGYTASATRSGGVVGEGHVSASADTGSAIGVRGYATDTHAGGLNIGLYGDASNGSSSYSLYLNNGDIYSANAKTWTFGSGGLTLGGTTTLSGGTANGVLYLNGSKAVTSGSALTFDGTNLGVGTASPESFGAGFRTLELSGSDNNSGGVFKTATSGSAGSGSTGTETMLYTDSTGGNLNVVTAHPLLFYTSNQERMRLDSSGNLGLGVTPSGWSSFKAMQVQRASLASYTTDTYLSHNWYWSGSADTYIATDYATRYSQSSGKHIWWTAPSGTAGNAISFTQAMTLNASGNLGIGTTSPDASAILDAQSTTKGVRFPNMTTTQKNAIASPAAGLVVFDTTLAKLCLYTGAAWQTITSV